jgi:hypothetical protein
MHKFSSVYSERGVPLPVLNRAGNESVSGHAKMPPASHQVSATSLELWGRSPYSKHAQCGILLPVFRALVFGLALCFGESTNLT